MRHILKQLEKLFVGKVVLVLDEADMEELILAAVPALHMAGEESSYESSQSMDDIRRHSRLDRLAKELDEIPRPARATVINLSTSLN